MRTRYSLCLGLLLISCNLYAMRYQPSINADILGGQFYFNGENTSLSGNARWVVAPAMALSDKFLLIPTLSGQYKRTKEVQSFAGGGVLTQEVLNNTLNIRTIYRINDKWSLKPFVSYKNELSAESRDEKLGKGLFDFNKMAFGVGAEQRDTWFKSIRHELNFYRTSFYHYTSLASEQAGEEIKSGKRTLNFDAAEYSVDADYVYNSGAILTASSIASFLFYPDQNIVKTSGMFESTKRKDNSISVSLNYQKRLSKPPARSKMRPAAESFLGLGLGYTVSRSNQNNYDAARTKYNPGYYNSNRINLSPEFTLLIKSKLSIGLAYDFAAIYYTKRPVQDKSGAYKSNPIIQNTQIFSLNLNYPIAEKFSFKISGAYSTASSNMKYEPTFKYNYNSMHYFTGLGYEF